MESGFGLVRLVFYRGAWFESGCAGGACGRRGALGAVRPLYGGSLDDGAFDGPAEVVGVFGAGGLFQRGRG